MVEDEFDESPGPKVGNGDEKASADGVYDPWRRGKPSFFQKILNRSETPFILLGAGLLIFILIFFLFVPRSGEEDVARKASLLEKRISPLEDKLARLEEKLAKLQTPAVDPTGKPEKQAACERAIDRFESVEASLTMRVEKMAQELERFKAEIAHSDKKPLANTKAGIAPAIRSEKKPETASKTVTPTAPAEKKPETASKAAVSSAVAPAKPGLHEVRAGETLYRISKQYNLSVDELKRLNKLPDNASISTGQKLIVSGSGEKGR